MQIREVYDNYTIEHALNRIQFPKDISCYSVIGRKIKELRHMKLIVRLWGLKKSKMGNGGPSVFHATLENTKGEVIIDTSPNVDYEHVADYTVT